MPTQLTECPNCGGPIKHMYSDAKNAYYQCTCCPYTYSEEILEGAADASFEIEKHKLLARIEKGMMDWEKTNWEQMYRDVDDFMHKYEVLQKDMHFNITLAACLTKGFNKIDDRKYADCKKRFKITKKMYKEQLKLLKQQADPALHASVEEYKEARDKYTKCLCDYLNEKAIWKVLIFLLKKLSLPFPV